MKLTRKLIKERCGDTSYKGGETFFRKNKVMIQEITPHQWKATVSGTEDFQVTVTKDEAGNLLTACSCPTLASFKKDCQHIAAVLLTINERQEGQQLTDSFFNLFKGKPQRSSSHQPYFDDREVLEVSFTCEPVRVREKDSLFGIGVSIGSIKVNEILPFLKSFQAGAPFQVSSVFTIDLSYHCFDVESDAVIKQLIEVMEDKRFFEESGKRDLLVIPPSSWEKLLPLLEKTHAYVENGEGVHELQVAEERLPLRFELDGDDDKGYHLNVAGLDTMLLLQPYRVVAYKGRINKLAADDCRRIAELQRVLEKSPNDSIPIPGEQLRFFLEQIVPGLHGLGEVSVAKWIRNKLGQEPLVAKLYLDRIRNRLLASLEFHYGHVVINPVKVSEPNPHPGLLRDTKKEQQLLDLMEESLFTKTETGYYLQNEELEYDFLRYQVPRLQRLSSVYTTTAVRTRVVKDRHFPKIRVKVNKERSNWLEFKFEMEGVPDEEIKELLSVLEEKRKYYRLKSGSLLSLETKEFQEVQRFLSGLPVKEKGLENGLSIPPEQAVQLLDSFEGSSTFITEKSFREFLDAIRRPGSLKYDVPVEMQGVLKKYQVQGYRWMKTLANYRVGGILADDMGLGKTVQSIAYMLSVVLDCREGKMPVLVVCPSSVTYNWKSELEKFAPDLLVKIVDGPKTTRKNKMEDLNSCDVVITSYPILRRDISAFERISFHTVFYDEAQAFKNPITQTARAVKRIKADYRFALTGTPVENSLEELWSIFHVVFPELFRGLQEYSHLTKKTISRRAKPFILRRLKKDVLSELPKKRLSLESVELFPEQKKLYAAYLAKLRHDTLKHLDKDTFRKNKIRILAGLTRLRQICLHPGLFVDNYQGSSSKFEKLFTLIDEAQRAGRRVLIFSQFTKMLDLIGRELAAKGNSFFYLDGQTPSEKRVGICNRFNEGERDLFLISLKAGGTGLNLTGADTVIMFDSWWNPAVEEQAEDRAYRIGQFRDVQVIKLVTRGSIEEKMNDLQEKKRHLFKELIDAEADGPSELSEDDIKELLSINA
ncbi:DEAD/DEAH box helicase [Sediminibacillus massiliensis]|uniref:DEAD/DEAH box helicase n=1 Tax=Sediminibacillus massiliensis TaxID=1926277 RepID=UPI00098890D7|nr:DEAD/DEAH box helicase [Sediminibacillus massiliensis]